MRRLPAALLLVLAACAETPPPAPPPTPGPAPAPSPPAAATPAPPTARQLDADATIAMASGATLAVPKGWWVTEGKDALVLEDPDRQLHATLLTLPERDAISAVTAGWKRVQPGFALKVHDTASPPPIRGWDAITQVNYETRVSDHRVAFAVARRYGDAVYVALVDGDKSAVGRREAQLDTALWTLQPPGMHEESFLGKTPRPLDATKQALLDAFVEQARTKLDVPGAAVAVLQGGKVVYEKGFGARALGKKEAVTPATLFMIGSVTKSMTTMLEASLVDAGKLGWDTPVTQVLPTFALGDADVTSKLTMAHTACACTGMPRQDMEFLFEFANVTPEQRIASMRSMKPTTGFGETFQYSNLLVAAGGYAAAHTVDPKAALGPAYDAAMRARVFGPIGMNATTFDFARAEGADHAMPHAEAIDGTVRPIPLAEERFVVPVRPAGGAWSNLHDMERYVMTEIAKGVAPDGKRVISEASILERRRPRVRSSDVESYGLGLEVGTFRDLPVVFHTGGTLGFTTLMHILPEQGVAVIVLSNSAGAAGPFVWALHRKAIEMMFDGKDLAQARVDFAVKRKQDDVAKALERLAREPDKEWIGKLAGSYSNPSLGKVHVTFDAKGATFDAGEWRSAVGQKTKDDGTLELMLLDPPFATLELIVGGDDAHPTLTLETDQQKYLFEREAK